MCPTVYFWGFNIVHIGVTATEKGVTVVMAPYNLTAGSPEHVEGATRASSPNMTANTITGAHNYFPVH